MAGRQVSRPAHRTWRATVPAMLIVPASLCLIAMLLLFYPWSSWPALKGVHPRTGTRALKVTGTGTSHRRTTGARTARRRLTGDSSSSDDAIADSLVEVSSPSPTAASTVETMATSSPQEAWPTATPFASASATASASASPSPSPSPSASASASASVSAPLTGLSPESLYPSASSSVAPPSPSPPGGVRTAQSSLVVVRSCTVPGTVAVTYDDGPYHYQQGLIDVYRNASLVSGAAPKMTLFVNGNNWDCVYKYGSSLNAALADGHQIGHHSWAHGDLTTMTAEQITADMNRLDYALQRLIGKAPLYARPPYGRYNQSTVEVLTGLGYSVLTMWNFNSDDYQDAPDTSVARQQYEAFNESKSNLLSLEHETYNSTVTDLTPWIFDWARQRNVRMVTVAECLGDTDPANWYRQVTVPAHYPAGCS